MCGRFYIPSDDAPEDLLALLNRAESNGQRLNASFQLPRGEVRPGDCAAVVALNRASRQSVFAMKWGFRTGKQLLINARSETANDKPTFRQSMQDRRCLIPASAYFEWDHREKPMAKYRFACPDAPFFYLAGLYRFEPDSPFPVFTVLTRSAVPAISDFHDRMPVILPQEATSAWLDRSRDPLPLLARAITALTWHKA